MYVKNPFHFGLVAWMGSHHMGRNKNHRHLLGKKAPKILRNFRATILSTNLIMDSKECGNIWFQKIDVLPKGFPNLGPSINDLKEICPVMGQILAERTVFGIKKGTFQKTGTYSYEQTILKPTKPQTCIKNMTCKMLYVYMYI